MLNGLEWNFDDNEIPTADRHLKTKLSSLLIVSKVAVLCEMGLWGS